MTREFRVGGEEPDRGMVLADEVGDMWWFANNYWGYTQPDGLALERPNALYTWDELGDAFGHNFILTQIGWNEGGRIIQALPNGEKPVFVVKDSGAREQYDNGFVRDTEQGKYDYARVMQIKGLHLIPVEALERWAAHMVLGAEKYGEDNWRQARGLVAKARFLRSLARHIIQYIQGDRTEDHAAAVCFNVWAAELTPEGSE